MSVLVFGAAGDLGSEITRRLLVAKGGAGAVLATTRSAERLSRIPAGAIGLVGHAATPADADALVQAAIAQLTAAKAPPLSGVVLAGGRTMNKLFLRTGDEDLAAMMEDNYMAPMRLTRSVLKQSDMLKRRQGSFIGLSSVVGQRGNPGQLAYGASKAALEGAFATLAREYGSRGVRFNTVSPGLIDATDMAQTVAEAQREGWKAATSLQRLGASNEVADAVIAILGLEFVTGQNLRVCGGL